MLEKFAETCIDEFSQQLMLDIKKIIIARKHKAFQPETKAHRDFLKSYFEKVKILQEEFLLFFSCFHCAIGSLPPHKLLSTKCNHQTVPPLPGKAKGLVPPDTVPPKAQFFDGPEYLDG